MHEQETTRIRVERLLFPPAVVAGMNILVISSLAYMLRGTTEDPQPITVTREGEFFRIRDGRHRTTAAILAGRPDVLAVIEEA